MTPEEFAASLEAGPRPAEPAPETSDRGLQPAWCFRRDLGTSDGTKRPSVRQYARQLAAGAGHIGLIEADGAEFIVTCFERMAVRRHRRSPSECRTHGKFPKL